MENKKYLDYCECLELTGKCAAEGILSNDTQHLLDVANSLMKNPEEQRLLRRVYVQSRQRAKPVEVTG